MKPAACHVRFTVLGNPRSRRVTGFCAAAAGLGCPPPRVVRYEDQLSGRDDVRRQLAARTVLRIESPGEDWEVEKLLLREGIEPLAAEGETPLSARQIAQLAFQRGALLRPRQWYLGYARFLRSLEASLAADPPQYMAHPADIRFLFDKVRCQVRFAAAGLPIPAHWTHIKTYQQLRDQFAGEDHRRLFVKISCGYSALGAVALEWRGGQTRAISAVEMVRAGNDWQMFLSKKIRCYQDERQIAALIDALGRESLIVEAWLPKARFEGRPFDLRVVTIAGRPRHVVGRAGNSPFTNLNLGAKRMDAATVRQHLDSAWRPLQAVCRRVAALFPDSLYLGIDLLVLPDRKRFAVLEANAFGDLLPGLMHRGRSTYEAEIMALLKQREHAAC